MSDNKMHDPLQELINKHKRANGITVDEESVAEETSASSSNIDYGENDLTNEIEAEKKDTDEKKQNEYNAQKKIQQEKEAEKTAMPPQPYDMKSSAVDIAFQADKIAIVTTMVNKVISKYHIITGGIPEVDANGNAVKRKVMGDLIDLYHVNGDVITTEFENTILSNWILPSGITAAESIAQHGTVNETDDTNADTSDKDDDTPKETKPESPTINITVEKNTPVTINVDETVVSEISKTNEINILVKEVSEAELKAATIIENTQQKGVIKTYDSGINDVPVTLPLSGYRCVIRSINWFDFIKLTAPTSQNASDNELKKWSVIYDHIKNPSIGDFKDFDDFLKKTKYQDRELLMWAILVATADEEENISLKCYNPKCRNEIKLSYRPREIIHLDEELLPATYLQVYNASIGSDAYKLWEQVNCKRRRYKLPNTGHIVEINEPSAYEYITVRLPLIQKLYERYRPGEQMSNLNVEDPTMVEFDYLAANALFISAINVIKDDVEYRFTNWDDIESIITSSLDSVDSGVLFKLIEKTRSKVSPVSFYIADVKCDSCKRVEKKIAINDIGNTLLFQVSRRLSNTEINLIEMD